MNKLRKISAALAVALLALGLTAACDQMGGGKSAYVDVQKVIRDSKAGRDLNRQIKTYSDNVAKKVRPEQERLEREQKELTRQQNVLSPAAFRQKENSFREKVVKFQQKMQGENQKLQRGGQETLSEVETVLAAIYKELLEKHNLELILNRSVILNASEDLDLTPEVIELLDVRLSSVKLTVPQE